MKQPITYIHWASKIITSLKRLNFRVIDLKDKKANKKNIENALIKKNPSLVIFNGHGSPTEICGDNNEVLINLENKKHLKSKIVYSISCSSARELGKKVADENTSFAGYEEEFIFLIDKNKACTHLRRTKLRGHLWIARINFQFLC